MPIYWGDTITPQVFNPERIILLEATGLDDPNLSKAIDKVAFVVTQLEENATFRKMWFSRPLLQPEAPVWVEKWVANLSSLTARARVKRAEGGSGASR